MSTAISPQDWQRLSEYLDGQLEQSDRREVEKMLAESTDWRDASQDLKQVRFALHHAPKRRAPRNFTISAAQAAAIRKPRKSIWFFRVSSAFSTALALLFLVLGFSLKALPQAVPMAAAPAAMAPAMDKAAVNNSSTPIPVIIWGSPDSNSYMYSSSNTGAMGMGGGGGGGGAETSEMSSAEAKAPVPSRAEPPLTSSAVNDTTRSFAPETTATPEAEVMSAEVLEPVTGTGPILGIQSTGPAAATQPGEATSPAPTPKPAAEKSWGWWIAAALLGIAALVTAFLGWKPTDKS